MIALRKIILAVCLINCSMHAMDLDDDNDVADVSSAMRQMHLDDEDPEDSFILDPYEMVHYSMHGGCGRLPLREAFEPYVKDDLFDDDFKSYVLGNIHSQELRHWGQVRLVAFDPSGTLLATGNRREVCIFKLEEGDWQCKQRVFKFRWINSVAFDPQGTRLATGWRDKKARIYSKQHDGRWKCEQELQHGDWVNSVAFDPQGTRLATGCRDKKVRIYSKQHDGQWKCEQELQHGDSVSSVAFDPSGALLATGSFGDRKAPIFKRTDNGTWQREQELPHGSCVYSVAFDPSGTRLATGGNDRKVRIFKVKDGNWQCIKKLRHRRPVSSVAFDPSGDWLATGSCDRKARIFKLTDGNWQCIKKLRHGRPVSSVAFDPSGDWLATGSRDRKARIFKLAALKQAEDIWLIPENEKQYDLLLACQIARRKEEYVHVTDEQLATFNKLPERMRNALKQFIVTKEQYDRIKQNNSGSMLD